MNVIVFGATGMVGAGVLLECLEDPRVRSVLVLGRKPCGVAHSKLRELLRADFLDYSDAKADLRGLDACFFCLGVSAAGMTEAAYTRVTYDLTLAAARALIELNPGLTFCYVSGEGTDSTERGRFMWARVKGKTENDLLRMPFKAYMFRPGFIQPLKGVRSKTKLYQAFYTVLGPVFPLLRRLLPKHATTTENVGRAMIRVATGGYSKRVLENPDSTVSPSRPSGEAGDTTASSGRILRRRGRLACASPARSSAGAKPAAQIAIRSWVSYRSGDRLPMPGRAWRCD